MSGVLAAPEQRQAADVTLHPEAGPERLEVTVPAVNYHARPAPDLVGAQASRSNRTRRSNRIGSTPQNAPRRRAAPSRIEAAAAPRTPTYRVRPSNIPMPAPLSVPPLVFCSRRARAAPSPPLHLPPTHRATVHRRGPTKIRTRRMPTKKTKTKTQNPSPKPPQRRRMIGEMKAKKTTTKALMSKALHR